MHARTIRPVMLCCALLLAGCGALSPRATAPVPSRPEESTQATGFAERLAAARADYYEAVRAYVREDFADAERLFLNCEARLEDPVDEQLTQVEEREAESLLHKTAYFLQKIAARELAEHETPETPAPPEPQEEVESGPPWPLVTATITPAHNRDVDRWLRYFRNEGRGVFQKWLNRRSRYQPIIDDALARHGLPPELIYHAMIESGFSNSAYSWAHAVGLWQFIRGTGRKYGLRCDWWVDERRDPVKSTEAAALYLKALYREFHDWELALAAYNVGEAVVRRQIRRQNTRDFWKLKLPRETRNHVPKFHAAMTLGQDPEKYGFTLEPDPQLDTEMVRVSFTVDFEVLGELCGVSVETLAELNPALLRRCTPPDEEGYPVVIPAGTGEHALAELARLPEEKRVRWAHHRVRRGETVSHLAQRYRTTVRAIAEANGLRSAHRLSIGQDLLIPQGRRSGANPPSFASTHSQKGPTGPVPAGTRRVVYTVKKGDTLSEIAERYGTSSRMLRRWNRIGRFIHPGDRLTIYVRGGSSGKLAAANDEPNSFYVKVRKGDTLWDLARHYGVSFSALLNANNLRRGSLIRPGDRILIPKRTG